MFLNHCFTHIYQVTTVEITFSFIQNKKQVSERYTFQSKDTSSPFPVYSLTMHKLIGFYYFFKINNTGFAHEEGSTGFNICN